jgi:hypothetical protein
MIGTTVGKYRIVGQLGRGATGVVYRAVDDALDREVAIKALNPHFAVPDLLKRFRAEATTLARLSHPEIATIYDLLAIDTDLFMVMELVRGETLEVMLERVGALPPDRAGYLLDGILSALDYAHRAGVVHRDLKPANIMVTDLGAIKIMDFGIARVRGAEHMTIDGCTIGTPAYMPPEQVLGEEVDGRADLYAVGVILYRLLSGKLPFDADVPLTILQKQVAETPPPLHVHRAGLPDWCEAVVGRALAKSPAERFQTAEEFRAAIGLATGLASSNDLAKAFAVSADQPAQLGGQVVAPATLEIVRTEASLDGSGSALGPAGLVLEHVRAIVAPATRFARSRKGAGLLLGAAALGIVAYMAAGASAIEPPSAKPEGSRPTARSAPSAAPPAKATAVAAARTAAAPASLVFPTKVVVGKGEEQREEDAQLSLTSGRVSVTPYRGSDAPVFSVPYDEIAAIHYSRAPAWKPPKKWSRVIRLGDDVLDKVGIRDRHRISLHTDEKRLIVMRVDERIVSSVLKALEDRTGRSAEVSGR